VGASWVLRTREDEDSFRRHWEAGVSLRDLAAWFGWAGESGPAKAARRLGLEPRRARVLPRGGRPPVLATPEQVAAFEADWAAGVTLAEMAALHGFRHPGSVSYQARRLGLSRRRGGRRPGAPHALTGGRWVRRRGVLRWVGDEVA
jgi:hypothetical protein